MKNRRHIPLVMAIFIGFSLSSTVSSCKVKEGCAVEEELKANTDKRTGELSMKRGSTNLFDKKRVSKSRKKKG